MGVGARAMGLGGAVVASTSDVHSIYWNPAGLVEAGSLQVAIGRQINARLVGMSFAGVSCSPGIFSVRGLKAALGLSWMTRLHVRAKGRFKPEDLESVLLKFTLPGLPDDFDGTINSKTRDYRLGLALSPRLNPRWSFGVTVGWVDCRTTFCGVTAEDPGNVIVGSTDATALSLNLGAKLFLTENLTFGTNMKDLDTGLDVITVITDQDGTREESNTSEFPRDLTFGFLWARRTEAGSGTLELEVDYQTLFGEYGTSSLDFKVIRGGLQKIGENYSYRIGLLIPLAIKSEFTGDVKDEMPLPFSVTLGLARRWHNLSVDLALYPHPVMSYARDRLYPGLNLSVGWGG